MKNPHIDVRRMSGLLLFSFRPLLLHEFREDIFVAVARKEFEYMIRTTFLNLVNSTLHMNLYTPSTH